jgi:hypothetical protein
MGWGGGSVRGWGEGGTVKGGGVREDGEGDGVKMIEVHCVLT